MDDEEPKQQLWANIKITFNWMGLFLTFRPWLDYKWLSQTMWKAEEEATLSGCSKVIFHYRKLRACYNSIRSFWRSCIDLLLPLKRSNYRVNVVNLLISAFFHKCKLQSIDAFCNCKEWEGKNCKCAAIKSKMQKPDCFWHFFC